jgi:hypothetical protein
MAIDPYNLPFLLHMRVAILRAIGRDLVVRRKRLVSDARLVQGEGLVPFVKLRGGTHFSKWYTLASPTASRWLSCECVIFKSR